MDWHRLFGITLTDFFVHSPFQVEVEYNVSIQQQFVDVVVVRRQPGLWARALPHGLAPLALYNLFTFKAGGQALNGDAIRELLGYFVAYRKLVSPHPRNLLPLDQFRLFGISSRFPQALHQVAPLRQITPGVYDCQWAIDTVRIVSASDLPLAPENALLHLFSNDRTRVESAWQTLTVQSPLTSTVIHQLLARYRREGLTMAYTKADFDREVYREVAQSLRPEQLAEVFTPEQLVACLTPEQRLAGMTPEQINAALAQLGFQLTPTAEALPRTQPSAGGESRTP
jgi:hypothetical protein